MTNTDFNKATRLIQAATGEPYGDGLIVTNIGVGFADPSYGAADELWVTGNWNPKRFRSADEPALTNVESLAPRLGEALESRANVTTLWLDEWAECAECYKIVRTVADSYSWKALFVWSEDGDLVCEACATFDDIEWNVNDSSFAVTFDVDLGAEGFVKYNRESYENGWHPGQDDNPATVLAEAHEAGWSEGLFVIPSVGQFDINFDLWVRNDECGGCGERFVTLDGCEFCGEGL